MGFLVDMYKGKINVAEDFGYNSSEEYKNLLEKSSEVLNQLKDYLSDGEIEMLDKYCDLLEEKFSIELERMFHYAFKLGFKSAIDIIN